jgi:hypothetical protein
MCLRSAKDTGEILSRQSGRGITIDFKCCVHIDADDAEKWDIFFVIGLNYNLEGFIV